jgi:hypothetical protein
MSSRLLAGSLLLVMVGIFAFSMMAPSQQPARPPVADVRWEYKVIHGEGNACAAEPGLNSLGQQGWELVAYEKTPSAFPRDAQGSMLIRPAATGPNKDINPPTADSFQGTITMRMGESQPVPCAMIFKRPWHSTNQ